MSDSDNWHNEILREEGWFEMGSDGRDWGFKILGGSESFEAAIEDLDGDLELAEEDAWMSEAEEIPVSAEEVVQKIRLALGTRAEPGGGGCGRTDRPCCGGSCQE